MWQTNRYLRATLSVLVTLTCLYLFGLLRGFFTDIWGVVSAVVYPFAASLVITYILQPVVDALHRRGVPRSIAILCIYFAFALLIVVALVNAIPVITRQVSQLISNMPNIVAQANHWIDLANSRKQYLPDAVRIGLENALNKLEQGLTTSASGVFTFIGSAVNTVFIAFVVPFLVFYMLKDAKSMGRAFVRVAPEKHRRQIHDMMISIDQTLGRYIRGQFLVMLGVGILAFAGYLVVGMPYALLLALFLAVADIVPYLGPIIGAAPAVIIALTLSPSLLIKVVIVNIIVQQCEGNLISPQIMGRSLKLHPMAIVAALLVGGELGGVLGLIVAVPLLAVLKVIWLNIVQQRRVTRK